MKKSTRWLAIITILLSIIMCFTLVACGGNKDSDTDTDTEADSDCSTFTVTFKQEGEADVVITVESGKTIDIPTPKAVAGYTVAWDQDLTGVAITQNVVVNVVKKTVENAINYNMNGGTNSIENPTKFTVEDSITFAVPTRPGYDFKGWYRDSAFVTPITGISKGTTIPVINVYAKWETSSFDIVYITNGGTNPIGNPTSYNAESIGAFLAAEKPGYEFLGWYINPDFTGSAVDSLEDIASQTNTVTLYAKYRLERFTITYVNANGASVINNNAVDFSKEEAVTFIDPSRYGYTFDGWYSDATYTTKIKGFAAGTEGDQTVYAKWTATKYTITYKYDDESKIVTVATNPSEYSIETNVDLLAPTVIEGYEFIGWFIEGTANQVTAIVPGENSGDLVLEGKFQLETYDIDYHTNGGTLPENASYTFTIENIDSNKIALPVLVRDGYTFNGWYTEDSFVNKITEIDGAIKRDISVYASWTVVEYTITYNYTTRPEITTTAPTKYSVENKVTFEIFESTDEDIFKGWYLESDFKTKVYDTTGLVGDLTVYAKWSKPITKISSDEVDSFTGAETRYGDWKQLFDGNSASAGGWHVANGWTGGIAEATITLDKEYYITSAQLYLWSNWSNGSVKFYDEEGNLTGEYNGNADSEGNILAGPEDNEKRAVFISTDGKALDLCISNINVKKIVLITSSSKGDRNHQWVELILNVGKAPVEAEPEA